MNSRMKAVAAIVLAASVVSSYAYAGDGAAAAKKHAVHKKAAAPKGPTVEEQIEALRQQLQSQQGQIDNLKNDLTTKDEQLKQAQQQAADAQTAAARAQQEATDQAQAATQNQAAVSTLQSTVTDLKANQATLTENLTDTTSTMKKEVEHPDAIHVKGATISFAGSFLAAETVWRQGATGGGLNTQFTGVPLQFSDAAQLTEFQGSGRQSRLAIKAVGKLRNWTMTGYYEADFLSAGVTSNNNQSNSYTMRQRNLWADARMNSGWDFSGGTGWSLVTETTKGLQRGTEILPATIDPQYEAGFVWTRQYSFRVTRDIANKFFLGASAENAETLNPAGANLPTNLLIGSGGNGGGLYNPTANYSFNLTPDFVAKMAMEPGWGHWELFGIARSFRDRIYPAGGTPFNHDPVWGAGVGGGFRAPLATNKVTIGLKGLWGQGVGRYGSSTIADITLRPNGAPSPMHGFSGLSTLEMNPTKRLMLYFNYGGDYIARNWTMGGGKEVGYGTYTADMSGCNAEPASTAGFPSGAPNTPAHCTNQNKDVQEFTAGNWYDIYNGPEGRMRFGLQYSRFERDLWSGAGGTTNPGGGAKGVDNMFWTSFRYYLP
ncbi:MAG TPA: hypothetical protein VMU71_03790 [Terracidiphilus sp.]|nr:hypothetical protein [Terracidiphilus sp.]